MTADSHDPFTGAKLSSAKVDRGDHRLGVPADKFGMTGMPVLLPDRRQAVMLMIFPPEALRDAPLDVIEQVVANGAQGTLKAIAAEIHKSFTSDPVDAASARNLISALEGHIQAIAGGRA